MTAVQEGGPAQVRTANVTGRATDDQEKVYRETGELVAIANRLRDLADEAFRTEGDELFGIAFRDLVKGLDYVIDAKLVRATP